MRVKTNFAGSKKSFATSSVAIAATRTFDFEGVAEPDAPAPAAPVAGHLALSHAKMARHGAGAEIGEAAGAPRRRRPRERESQDLGGLLCFVVLPVHSQILAQEQWIAAK